MKYKKKFDLKKLITLLIILCSIVLVVLYNIVKNKEKEQNILEVESEIVRDRYLKLNGFGVFFEKYDGNLRSSDVSSKFEELITKDLPDIYSKTKDLNDTELEEYFNSNNFRIKSDLGIKNVSDFKKLITDIKETNVDIEQWDKLDVLKDTFVNDSDLEDYSYVEFEVTNTDGKKIRYSAYVSKIATKEIVYIISIAK